MNKENKKSLKKKLKRTLFTATTAASLLVGNTYDDVDDLLNSSDSSIDPVIENYQQSKKKTWKTLVRGWLDQLPYAVKLLVILPLWITGWLLMKALAAIYSRFLAGYMGDIINWLIIAAVMFLTIVISNLLINPEVPLKKVLNKKTIGYTLISVATLAIVDGYCGYHYSAYLHYSSIVKFCGCLAIIAAYLVKTKLDNPKLKINLDTDKYQISNY